MAYLGDPREGCIDQSAGVIWENDKRIEQRGKWNGAIVDYCNFPIEKMYQNALVDAIEHIQIQSAVTKETVLLTATNVSGTSVINVKFTKAPASSFYVVANCNDNKTKSVQLTTASTSPVEITFDEVITKVNSVYLGATVETAIASTYSDDKYNYQINTPMPTTLPTIKYISKRAADIATATTDEQIANYALTYGATPTVMDADDAMIPMSMPSRDIPGLNELPTAEVEEKIAENYYKYIILCTKQLNTILQNEIDEFANWEKKNTEVTISGQKYYLSLRNNKDEQVNIYDSQSGQSDPGTITNEYRITY